ncbi:MAG: CHAT domain-containing protein [Roseofilum sp. Guam]|nr:CHAT domain-containing protein [Roseofilum sp. Guam]
MKIGYAYTDRSLISKTEKSYTERAIHCFNSSLHVYSLLKLDTKSTKALFNLGLAYKQYGYLELALSVFKEVLNRSNLKQSFPKSWEESTNNFLEQVNRRQSTPKTDRDKLQETLIIADTVEFLQVDTNAQAEVFNSIDILNKLHQVIVEVCLELGNFTTALEYVDRSKARNLTELIATRDAYPGGEIPSEVRQRLQQLRQVISEEDRRLKQDSNPDYTHITQLREEFQAKYPYKPLKFSDIQSLLDDETVILEWYVLDDKFLTFTLTNNSLNLWTSSEEDRQKLIDWAVGYINDYRNNKTQWQNQLPQRLEQLAQILHLDEILQNLRKKFPNCKQLILIPHRFLHLFPLHALPIATGKNQRQTLQELFSKGVNYSPNCQVLQQAQKRINQRPDFDQLFAIQNPTNDLDFTDIEVEAIQNYFNPHHILKHEEAEKTAVNLNTAHCTHFSCHGYFNFNNPLQSALLLAKSILQPPPPQDDETRYLPLENGNFLDLDKCLTLEDILRLDLTKCRLVTLSACETGITDFTSTSDEYIGLPSGFILAGSPNVVSSLWAVNDLSTALLMIRFYQNVKNGETVPLALREAQIWLRDATVTDLVNWIATFPKTIQKQIEATIDFDMHNEQERLFESPYHWAAFCAIGQ